MSENNDKIMKAFVSINEQMEANLVESIISLFHQGVLRHYVRNPRQILDENNFKMTIEAANGVTFEGREKIIELEQENESLKKKLEKAEEIIKKAAPIIKESIWVNHQEEDHLYEFKKEFLKLAEMQETI